MTNIQIVNAETNEVIDRKMSDEELLQYETDAAEITAFNQAQLAKADEKAALLAKLGITEDEAKLLLA